MVPTLILTLMAAFAAVSAGISRRRGIGITRRPYGKRYGGAPGARDLEG